MLGTDQFPELISPASASCGMPSNTIGNGSATFACHVDHHSESPIAEPEIVPIAKPAK